jgi:hypothetical protein
MSDLRSTFVSAFVTAAILLAAPAAFADIPAPSNDCFSAPVGSACTNAGPDEDQDGICMPGRCKQGSDTPTDASIACTECVATNTGDAGVPKNACPVETLGGSCNTAGPSFNQAGVCTIAPCGTNETCSLCELGDAGPHAADAGTKDASSHSSSSGASSASTSRGASNGQASSNSSLNGSSGCAIGAGGNALDGAWLFALGGIGLAGSAMSRRRRAR